ncbi:DUF3168 domain-containing protein [Berryella intestinalis]|uniref:DUF3168 domain-containing protein n=1 Tax=Berryella intestinalis TaxID=1531429 RepID=UPI0005808401|nr:DUF3168 domain-containing protein [Berryella intestinalis]
MDARELRRLLLETGMEVHYGHFTGDHPMPYLTYREVGTRDMSADNRALVRTRRWDIDLYTRGKQPEASAKVEALLDAHGIRFSATEYEAADGAFLQTVYEVRLMA